MVGNMNTHLFRQRPGCSRVQLSPTALILWLRAGVDCWLGSSLAPRLAMWLSMGIIAAQKLVLPPYLTWLMAVGWWGICCNRFCRKGGRLTTISLMLLLAITGAALFSVYWSNLEYGVLGLAMADCPVSVLARVRNISSQTPFQRSLVVDIKGTLTPQGILPDKGRAIVTQLASFGEVLDQDISVGDMVVINGRFRRPRQASNPGQFSYGHYLYRRGISLTAYVEGSSSIRGLTGVESAGLPSTIKNTRLPWSQGWLWLYHKIHILRHHLIAVWDRYLSARSHNLLAAMVLGDRNSLDPTVQEAFRRTGQAHLLSVSGLHIGFVTGGIWFLSNTLPCGKLLKCIITILGAWLYALIVGGNPPAIRAALTLTLYLLALSRDRGHHRLAATAWAAILQLLVNPSLIFDTSFQLSYGALLGILSLTPLLQSWLTQRLRGGPWQSKAVARMLDLVIISVSAQLAILPFLAYYFHEISVIGPILGLLTIPLVGLIVPLGLLGSCLGLVADIHIFLAPLLETLLALLEKLVYWCAEWSWTRLYLSAGSITIWVLYYLALTFALQCLRQQAVYRWLNIPILALKEFSGKTWVLWSLVIVLCLVYYPLVAPLWRPLEITFLDVGQGDAIFFRTPSGKNVLIDGGGLPSSISESSFDVGKDIVLPFLRHRGVRNLDLVVATHFHNDHTQGLGAILRELPVALLGDNGRLDAGFASQQYQKLLRDISTTGGVEQVVLRRGHYLPLSSQLELTVLHPIGNPSSTTNASGYSDTILDQNNESVVLKLRTPYYSILFTGDIDKPAQMELIRRNSLLPDAKVSENKRKGRPFLSRDASIKERFGLSASLLKVPHHGSREALLYSFLGAVSPSHAVISVGSNPFGHPAAEFLHALEVITGNTPWRTDLAGSIRVRIWGSRVRIDSYHTQPWWCVGNWPLIREWESRIRRRVGRV
jgi:competence protein ComEC